MRFQGLEEDVLRQFVCKYSGNDWEEIYEALFGYEAKLLARDRWGRGEGAKARPRYAGWRDPIVRWIDARLSARRAAKDQAVLQKIEERSLESQGVNLVTARRKAERAAPRHGRNRRRNQRDDPSPRRNDHGESLHRDGNA